MHTDRHIKNTGIWRDCQTRRHTEIQAYRKRNGIQTNIWYDKQTYSDSDMHLYSHAHRHVDIQTCMQTYRQTYRPTHTQTDMHTYITGIHTDIRTYKHTDTETCRHTDIPTDRHTDRHSRCDDCYDSYPMQFKRTQRSAHRSIRATQPRKAAFSRAIKCNVL